MQIVPYHKESSRVIFTKEMKNSSLKPSFLSITRKWGKQRRNKVTEIFYSWGAYSAMKVELLPRGDGRRTQECKSISWSFRIAPLRLQVDRNMMQHELSPWQVWKIEGRVGGVAATVVWTYEWKRHLGCNTDVSSALLPVYLMAQSTGARSRAPYTSTKAIFWCVCRRHLWAIGRSWDPSQTMLVFVN